MIYNELTRKITSSVNQDVINKLPITDAEITVLCIFKDVSDIFLPQLKKQIFDKLSVIFDNDFIIKFKTLDLYSCQILEKMAIDNTIELLIKPDQSIADIHQRSVAKIKIVDSSTVALNEFIKNLNTVFCSNIVLPLDLSNFINDRKILLFNIDTPNTVSFSQKEKLVKADPTGWVYNPASGVWTKSFGWDGVQTLNGW